MMAIRFHLLFIKKHFPDPKESKIHRSNLQCSWCDNMVSWSDSHDCRNAIQANEKLAQHGSSCLR